MRIWKNTKYAICSKWNKFFATIWKLKFLFERLKNRQSNCRKYITNYFREPFTTVRINNLPCVTRVHKIYTWHHALESTRTFAKFVLSLAIDTPDQRWRISSSLHELLAHCQSANSPTIVSSHTMKINSHSVHSVHTTDSRPCKLLSLSSFNFSS